jgi:hypothetical protein
MVIELCEHRRHERVEVAEVEDPAGLGVHHAAGIELHDVAVPMHAPAPMSCRHLGQEVRSLEGEPTPERDHPRRVANVRTSVKVSAAPR